MDSGTGIAKALIHGTIISVFTALCFFAAFVAAAFWIPQDQQTIRRHIVSAIVDGTFNARSNYGFFDSMAWPRHTLDCVLASMMLAPAVNPWVDAISNRHVAIDLSWRDSRVPPTSDCQALARALPELDSSYGNVRFVATDRYILGVRVFGRALLSMMSLEQAARAMQGIAFALLGAIGAMALWKLHSAKSEPASGVMFGSYLIIALCLALLYGVHFFDATLYFAPPDYTHFIFIMISLLIPLAAMPLAGSALYAASYGSLIAIFESLTGGIPFALAMLPLLLALGFRGDARSYFSKLVLLWLCFCVAVVASFAFKKILSIMLLDDQESFFSLLLYRMYGELPPASGTELSLKYLLKTYRRWSGLIALGSPNIGTGVVVGCLAVFIIETWRTLKQPWRFDRPILIACWLGVAVLIIWSAAFLNHTAVHPYFMARLLIIQVIGAAILLAVRWMERRTVAEQ